MARNPLKDIDPSYTVEVTVAPGQSLISDPAGPLGKGTRYLAGEKAMVHPKDVPMMIRRGVILTPQAETTPLIAEPPPIDQPVPKVTVESKV